MELGNMPVCCPVCTLYMREGVTLQSHLDTHPKDKVIEALVKFSRLNETNIQETSDFFSSIHNVLPSVSRAETTHCISNTGGSYVSPGRCSVSSFINCQHLLSSSGTGSASVLPQYVPLSAISGSENFCGPSSTLYPFLFHQQELVTPKKPVNATQPLMHIHVPPPSAKLCPHITTANSPTPTHATSCTNSPTTLTPSISQARLSMPINSIGQVPSLNVMHSKPVSNSDATDSFSQSSSLTPTRKTQKQHKIVQDNSGFSVANIQVTNNVSFRNSKSRSNSIEVGEKEQLSEVCNKFQRLKNNSAEISEKIQISEVIRNSRSRNNSTESNDRAHNFEQVFSDQLLNTSPRNKLSDAIAKEIEVETSGLSYKLERILSRSVGVLYKRKIGRISPNLTLENFQDHVEAPKEIVHQVGIDGHQEDVCDGAGDGENTTCIENHELVQADCDIVNLLQPSSPGTMLRVRNDLSSTKDSPVASPQSSEGCELVHELPSKEEDQSRKQNLSSKNPEPLSVASSSRCVIKVFATEDEYIISDSVYRSKQDFLNSDKRKSEEYDNFRPSAELLDLSSKSQMKRCNTSESVNAGSFEGAHAIAPPEFFSSPGHPGDNADSTNDSRIITELTTVPPDSLQAEPDVTTMNIQTDEMMPPKGELSEQESVGGNDSSLWAPVTRPDDDMCASYDLLARESWEASDGSDGEGNELFSPSVSEKLDIERSNRETKSNKSSSSRVGRKPKVQIARTYLCITCDKIFNCPKERRVHQRTSHQGEGGSRIKTIPKRTCSRGQDGEIKTKSVKCEKNGDVGNKNHSGGTDFTKFEEIFIVKTEEDRDEGVGNEDVKVNTCDAKTQHLKSSVKSSVKSCSDPKSMVSRTLLSCSLCDNTFATLKLLRSHVRTSHVGDRTIRLTCKVCNKRFPSEALMQVHFKIHPLECSRCGKYFYRQQNLRLHIKRHQTIRPFKCDICDKSFVTRQKLEEHNNTHTGNCPLKCSLCDDRFRRYSNLIEHKNRHHLKLKKKVKDFICHCGEIFHSKKKLEWHKEIHDPKPKSCFCCSEKYVHETSLTRHIRKAHDRMYTSKNCPKSLLIPCKICNGVFLKSSLATHMRIHAGLKPFSCLVCGKQFTTKWNLNLHRWTHASRSSKPFKCSLCKSAFFRQNDYKSHMHSHRNVRPYTCNYCGCQFIRKYNCQRHVREHERNKSFSCTICGKLFHRNYYLTEHLRVHSGSRPFVCNICGKASSTKSNHNKHVKIHHAREPLNTEG